MNKDLLHGKKYPKFTMGQEEKTRILRQLKTSSPRPSIQHRTLPILSSLFILLFVSVLGVFAYSYLFDKNPLRFGAAPDPYENFTMDLPENVTMKQQEDRSIWFMRDNEYVGGLKVGTLEELHSDQPLYGAIDKELGVEGMQYPTDRRLFHVKNQYAIQINHFYVKPDENKDQIYNIYFHSPAFELEEAMEIVKTFRVGD